MDIPVAHVNGARDMGSGPVASLYAPSSPGSEGGVLVQLLYGRRRIDRLIWGGVGWCFLRCRRMQPPIPRVPGSQYGESSCSLGSRESNQTFPILRVVRSSTGSPKRWYLLHDGGDGGAGEDGFIKKKDIMPYPQLQGFARLGTTV